MERTTRKLSTSVKVIVPVAAHPSTCLLAAYLASLLAVFPLFDDILLMIVQRSGRVLEV